MNPFNHFLISFNVLLLIFHNFASIGELVIFSLIFGTLIDIDELVSARRKKSNHRFGIKLFKKVDKGDLRSWVQEPFGLLIIGVPIGLFLAFFFKPIYFFFVIIPYALHIILDYMTIHEIISPLAPFSKKIIKTGIFRPKPSPPWFKKKNGVSENYVLILNILITILLLLIYL